MPDERSNPNRDQRTWNGHTHSREGELPKEFVNSVTYRQIRDIEQVFALMYQDRYNDHCFMGHLRTELNELHKDFLKLKAENEQIKKEILRVGLERNEALGRITAYEQMTLWGRVKFLFKGKL